MATPDVVYQTARPITEQQGSVLGTEITAPTTGFFTTSRIITLAAASTAVSAATVTAIVLARRGAFKNLSQMRIFSLIPRKRLTRRERMMANLKGFGTTVQRQMRTIEKVTIKR